MLRGSHLPDQRRFPGLRSFSVVDSVVDSGVQTKDKGTICLWNKMVEQNIEVANRKFRFSLNKLRFAILFYYYSF